MDCRRIWAGWLGLVVCAALFHPAPARSPEQELGTTVRAGLFRPRSSAGQTAAATVPVEELPPQLRARVRRVLDRPTLFTRGPTEVFTCSPTLYQWLLDHPDLAVRAWRRLGARCMDINHRGNGVFAWTDGQGSEVRWWTIYRTAQKRIWYAEGHVRVTGVLPMVSVRGVVVLHHAVGRNAHGRTVLRHQSDLFLHTDSKTAALVTRLMGPSAPRMAEQSAGQMEMFFSALAWYLDQYPRKAEQVLLGIMPTDAPEWNELHQRSLAPPPRSTASPPPISHSGV